MVKVIINHSKARVSDFRQAPVYGILDFFHVQARGKFFPWTVSLDILSQLSVDAVGEGHLISQGSQKSLVG